MQDPIPTVPIAGHLETDLTDLDQVLEKLKKLEADILHLRDDLPEMAEITRQMVETFSEASQDMQRAIILLGHLVDKHKAWSNDLATRLTFLLNLKQWLLLGNNYQEFVEHDDRHHNGNLTP